MLTSTSFRFVDFSNMPNRIMDILIGLLIAEAIHQIRKNHLLSKQYDFRKNFGWLLIVMLAISFLALAIIGNFLRRIKLNPVERILFSIQLLIVESGLHIFVKIEPKAAFEISKKIEEFMVQHKVSKITGIKPNFLSDHPSPKLNTSNP